MTRQEALRILWKRLLALLVLLLIVCTGLLWGTTTANTGILVFVIGNVGGYISVHRSLGDLKDEEIVDLTVS